MCTIICKLLFEKMKTHQNLWYPWGQTSLAWSTGDPRTVKPSCHMNLLKNGVIRATPYPDAPPGDRRAFVFSLAGREKNLLVSYSTSLKRVGEMPWFVTWKMPHASHAWPTRFGALGSPRSMMGKDSGGWILIERLLSEFCHECDSGTCLTDSKSRGIIWWGSRGVFLYASERVAMENRYRRIQRSQRKKIVSLSVNQRTILHKTLYLYIHVYMHVYVQIDLYNNK